MSYTNAGTDSSARKCQSSTLESPNEFGTGVQQDKFGAANADTMPRDKLAAMFFAQPCPCLML
jgi:hypothetical protein